MIATSHNGDGRLTPTQTNILDILVRADRRMTGSEITSRLFESHGPVGTSTVKGALSDLTRHGYLTNRQDVRPKGYGLPEWE